MSLEQKVVHFSCFLKLFELREVETLFVFLSLPLRHFGRLGEAFVEAESTERVE
jgi:hypothetical protein